MHSYVVTRISLGDDARANDVSRNRQHVLASDTCPPRRERLEKTSDSSATGSRSSGTRAVTDAGDVDNDSGADKDEGEEGDEEAREGGRRQDARNLQSLERRLASSFCRCSSLHQVQRQTRARRYQNAILIR